MKEEEEKRNDKRKPELKQRPNILEQNIQKRARYRFCARTKTLMETHGMTAIFNMWFII